MPSQVDDLRGSPMSVGSLEEIVDDKCVSLDAPSMPPSSIPALTVTPVVQPRYRVIVCRPGVLREHHVICRQVAGALYLLKVER